MRYIIILLLFFLLQQIALSSSSAYYTADPEQHCNLSSLPDPLILNPNKLTALISGFSPHRIPLLRSLALSLSSHPSILSVLILWFNPSTHLSLLSPLSSLPSSKISLHLHSSSSLISRFLPRPQIHTRHVLVIDDDLLLPSPSLSFAIRISASFPHRLIGFFARSHELDLMSKTWIYTVSPDKYSMVLTKAMILETEYLFKFSCWGRLKEAREYVERMRNCEDILMNFVVAMETREGPVLVEGRGVRDWGDPRNDGDESQGMALSNRRDHRKKRGECIREFHRLLGEMPLRYSHGKVVEGVGEQGLCMKGGKLVPCDTQ